MNYPSDLSQASFDRAHNEPGPNEEARCPECSHPMSEHEAGRCLHWSPYTQRGDPICGCLGRAA